MQEFFCKVVTERPRAGGGIKQPKGEKKEFNSTNWEDQPKREKIKQKWHSQGYGGKQFTDVLGPLYGYLLKQVNRPWDKVYSEICKNLKHSSLQQSHIRDHIDDFVETNVIMVGKVPCHGDGYGYGMPLRADLPREMLYVDSNTGILRKLKKKKTEAKIKPEPKFIKISDTEVAKQINDIWYMVTVQKANKEYFMREHALPLGKLVGGGYKTKTTYRYETFAMFTDPIIGKLIYGLHDLVKEYGMVCRAISKRQMNKKEIKKLGK